jgi:hypothetical protein
MKNQKYAVKLTAEERKELKKFIRSKSKKNTAQCKIHAKVLLCLDEGSEKPLTPEQTAEKCKLHRENIYKIRKQFVAEGLGRVLYRKKRETPPVESKITGEVEAHIIATACSAAPEGKKAWTLQMIADKVVLDGIVESLSDMSVMRTLKKRNISHT